MGNLYYFCNFTVNQKLKANKLPRTFPSRIKSRKNTAKC